MEIINRVERLAMMLDNNISLNFRERYFISKKCKEKYSSIHSELMILKKSAEGEIKDYIDYLIKFCIDYGGDKI